MGITVTYYYRFYKSLAVISIRYYSIVEVVVVRIGQFMWMVVALSSFFNASGQSKDHEEKEKLAHHRVTLLMANSFIPAADNIAGQNPLFIVPAWGINYDYWFNSKIALGLHNDFILQQYKIEKNSDESVIERSFPLVMSGNVLVKITRHVTLLAGAGREFEKHENFTLINTGIEYGFDLPNQWELSINLLYENKLNAYDSWMLGAGFSRKF